MYVLAESTKEPLLFYYQYFYAVDLLQMRLLYFKLP